MYRERMLPLPALVGLDAARQALLLLAVDPRLGGLVLAAPAGSGKSSLARGFRALQPGAPFVELPLSADEGSLLGGLDLEATLAAGARVLRAGVLARADGGAAYVDGLNLLADASANLLLAALDHREVRVEREGMSLRLPARFCLLGSYDPAEGPPRRHLLDRVGLLVVLPSAADAQQRAEVVRRNLASEEWRACPEHSEAAKGEGQGGGGLRPSSFVYRQDWDAELELLRGLVLAAREQLPAVAIADRQFEQLAGAAVAFGVQGQRADLFAARAACAAAALALRDTVEDDDVELALRLVILPRATRVPAADEPRPAPGDQAESQKPENREQRAKSNEQRLENKGTSAEQSPATEQEQTTTDDLQNAPLPEQILEALAADLPLNLSDLPFRAQRHGRSGSRGSTGGRRGRHTHSTPGDPRRARVDVAATLRAAAPWQRLRANDERRMTNQAITGGVGQPSSSVHRSPSVILRADDLRVKHFRAKAGALFCFAVDASGSMALHRMRQAKGAVHTLLQQAYVHRDRVALLAFRGSAADLLLPPSQSVELARRALDQLPIGGGTPLAAALLGALDVARQARSRGILQTVLVLLTDGRANVGLRSARAGVEEELRLLSRHVVDAGIQTIVVDTQRSYLSQGAARRLAGWLAGAYIYLPNASGAQIAGLALAASERR